MIHHFVQNYEITPGLTDLSSVVLNLLRSRLIAGTIRRFDIIAGGNLSGGSAIFNLRVDGVAQFAGDARPTILSGTASASKLGLNIAVTRGSRITLDLENNPHSGNLFPVTLLVDIEDAQLTQNDFAFSTISLANNAVEGSARAVGKVSTCWRVTTSRAARVRMYSTAAFRAADAARVVGVDIIGENGLLMEVITSAGVLTANAYGKKTAHLINGDAPATNQIYFAVQNLSGATGTVDVTLRKLTIEE